MDDGPGIPHEATRAAPPRAGNRDPWLEQRFNYLAGEQARLNGGLPLRRFLRGALVAYRRFLHTGEPAYRFHCWVTIRTVSAGLDRLERRGVGHDLAGSAPDGLDPGQASASLADQAS